MELIIYAVLAYWATGQTIYRNKILIGTGKDIFLQRFAVGFIFGLVLIPWAIISVVFRSLH